MWNLTVLKITSSNKILLLKIASSLWNVTPQGYLIETDTATSTEIPVFQ